MARIRTIKPKFWDDSKLAKISRDARLTYIGMWNFCDDLGVINAESIWLKSKIFPYDQIQLSQFEIWLTELQDYGFISQFSNREEDFYYLPNLTRHQVINKPNYKDVCVEKPVLQKIMKDSRNNHGTIPDESGGERNGEERKGEDVSSRASPFFEMFRRVSGAHISDTQLLTEVAKFQNKYPNAHPNQSGALINAWVANIGKEKRKKEVNPGDFV